MRVLTLNPGSSTMKASLVHDGSPVGWAAWPLDGAGDDATVVTQALDRWSTVDAVAIRFVHGGSRTGPERLDDSALDALERLVPLAPLHQPRAIGLARAVLRLRPSLPIVAAFDTAFHAELPAAAAKYPLPREWTRQGRLRRYGFHGLSCRHAARRTAELLDVAAPRLVCCHLGAGVSVTAIRDGRSVDTSMGFTPLEGPAMATRSGSVDPGLLLHVMRTAPMSAEEMEDALYHRSGLAGMSGTDGDLRSVLALAATGDPDATTALEVYLHRIRREIGAMAVALDRLDAIVFTGGVTAHQPELLGQLAESLGVLGIAVDSARCLGEGDRVVSPEGAMVTAFALGTGEDVELARDAEDVLAAARL
ncbi:acetate/propionate family kinase [Amycolatopsis keratiniphila]|uniref:Acetate kinase n=1 Tax=Amycolatopsis keratiniphila subsp. keratiniphila TaxID=227715 RepID=A0A1W2M169_9PSEU|nr:acetate kinase [Amycolatopsis keratiniphila]ONF73618.1 acetate kinase [Amycolatopsis keratiniphila subsp. keratiniphila]